MTCYYVVAVAVLLWFVFIHKKPCAHCGKKVQRSQRWLIVEVESKYEYFLCGRCKYLSDPVDGENFTTWRSRLRLIPTIRQNNLP
jgi:DNA-directed RNA polymerase subunit RPC12/RpoP